LLARVSWKSELDECFNEDGTKLRKLPPIWTGEIRSNPVTLRLR